MCAPPSRSRTLQSPLTFPLPDPPLAEVKVLRKRQREREGGKMNEGVETLPKVDERGREKGEKKKRKGMITREHGQRIIR